VNDQHLRMSDAEREQAAAELGEHYAEGRLTAEEHSERLDRIWAARTRAELAPVFSDLPGRFGPQSGPPSFTASSFTTPFGGYAAPARRRRGLPVPVMVILAVLVVATVVSHLPLILIGPALWWVLAARHHCGTPPRR
jgi:hypothetical protein